MLQDSRAANGNATLARVPASIKKFILYVGVMSKIACERLKYLHSQPQSQYANTPPMFEQYSPALDGMEGRRQSVRNGAVFSN